MMLSNRGNHFNNFFEEMFKDSFLDPFFSQSYDTRQSQLMKTDVQEKDGSYMVDIELPGFAKEEIQAELNSGYLTITANHKESNEEKDAAGNFIRRERYTGTCQRSFYVGEHVREEDIQAGFKDGILKLAIPKKDAKIEEQVKKIEIR